MIRSFRDRTTEAVFDGKCPKRFPADLFKIARRKLACLDAAVSLEVLRSPPGNQLEALRHDRAGTHSIRVNDQFRICFRLRIADQRRSRSSTITRDEPYGRSARYRRDLAPLQPGEVLREEFLRPLGLSAGKVAKACDVPRTRIERIASERLGITGDTAIRLGKVLGTGPELWMNLQARFETETARNRLGERLAELPQLNAAA